MVQTLLVEDSDAFRRTLRELLTARFPVMRVSEAANLASAVEAARARRPDIMFVDVRLPDGNGLDLVRGMSARSTGPQCCVVTAFDLPEYRDAAHRSGAAHFLAKASATPDDLL